MTMRALIIFAIFFACAVAENPPRWPPHWISTWNFVDSNSGALLNTGAWYYDATSMMLRQDNDIQCQNFPKGVNCTVIFKNNNVYVNVPTGPCCVCFTNFAMTLPDWLVKNNATYSGRGVYPLTNVPSTLWNFEADGSHIYYQGFKHKMPVALSGGGTDMQWVDITLQRPDAHVFDLPSSCKTTCEGDQYNLCSNSVLSRPRSLLEYLHKKN